jgi:hypothetical protein
MPHPEKNRLPTFGHRHNVRVLLCRRHLVVISGPAAVQVLLPAAEQQTINTLPLACWHAQNVCPYFAAIIPLQVLLPAAAGVAILAAGGGGASVPMFLVAGLLGFVFYLYRQQLALVGRLLSVASHALVDNPSIVGGSLLLQAGGETAWW